jgi:hypothetical protein
MGAGAGIPYLRRGGGFTPSPPLLSSLFPFIDCLCIQIDTCSFFFVPLKSVVDDPHKSSPLFLFLYSEIVLGFWALGLISRLDTPFLFSWSADFFSLFSPSPAHFFFNLHQTPSHFHSVILFELNIYIAESSIKYYGYNSLPFCIAPRNAAAVRLACPKVTHSSLYTPVYSFRSNSPVFPIFLLFLCGHFRLPRSSVLKCTCHSCFCFSLAPKRTLLFFSRPVFFLHFSTRCLSSPPKVFCRSLCETPSFFVVVLLHTIHDIYVPEGQGTSLSNLYPY